MSREKRKKVLVIRDGDRTLELESREVGGITVFTTTDEQQKEIDARYQKIIPPFTTRKAAS